MLVAILPRNENNTTNDRPTIIQILTDFLLSFDKITQDDLNIHLTSEYKKPKT